MTKNGKNNKNNLPAKADENTYHIMSMDADEISEILSVNLGNEALSVDDLIVVTVPGSGGTSWSIPTVEGDVDTKQIDGIIIHTQTTRAYWKTSFDDAPNERPDCVSYNGMTGVGSPGGDCISCPLNQFGSDAKAKGKACSEKRNMFIIQQNEILPICVRAPVMSLKNARRYLMGITSARARIHSVYTRLTLEATKNDDGVKYSRIVFTKIGDVEHPEISAKYAKDLKPYLEAASQRLAAEANGDGPGTSADKQKPSKAA